MTMTKASDNPVAESPFTQIWPFGGALGRWAAFAQETRLDLFRGSFSSSAKARRPILRWPRPDAFAGEDK